MTILYPLRYNMSSIILRFFFGEGRQMDRKKLGKKIKLARVERDLTQTQLARKIKAKQKSISRYETGASLPSIETLVKLARALKKPAGYFFDE